LNPAVVFGKNIRPRNGPEKKDKPEDNPVGIRVGIGDYGRYQVPSRAKVRFFIIF
jgi:hypothetical protein